MRGDAHVQARATNHQNTGREVACASDDETETVLSASKSQRDMWIMYHTVVLEVLPRTSVHAVAEYHTVVLETPADRAVAEYPNDRDRATVCRCCLCTLIQFSVLRERPEKAADMESTASTRNARRR